MFLNVQKEKTPDSYLSGVRSRSKIQRGRRIIR